MRILVTGFDAFGGETVNPALEAVKLLPAQIEGAQLVPLEIPTARRRSLEVIERAMRQCRPDVVVSVGQAGGRAGMTVERVGINVDDFRIPDNDGDQPVDEPIAPDGPDAYLTNLPIKAMVEAMREAGVPADVSNTAGTFVCNHVLYGVRHLCETRYPGVRNGFIHVPYLPEQVVDKPGEPSMELSDIVRGLSVALAVLTR